VHFVYIPPDTNYNNNLRLFWDAQPFIGPSARALYLGDFNGRIGEANPGTAPPSVRQSQDKVKNARGQLLLDLLDLTGLEIGNGRLRGDEHGAITCIKEASPRPRKSVVDLLLYSPAVAHDIKRFKTLPWSFSDHFPLVLVLELNETATSSKKPAQLTSREKLVAPANAKGYEAFSKDLDALLDLHEFTETVETEYSALRKFVHSTCKQHDLHKKQTLFTCKAKWFDKECLTQRTEKDRALRAMRRATSATQMDELISVYKDRNKKYKQLCREKRDEFNLKLQLSLQNHKKSSAFWAAVRTARQHVQKPIQIAKTAWHEHFSNVYAPYESYTPPCLPNTLVQNDALLDGVITTQEIKLTLKKLKTNKAPGSDLIPNEYWKFGSDKLIGFLASLFTLCLSVGRVPSEWGKAYIIPIHKKGDATDPSNFRPIALLNTISKLFTSVLSERLNGWISRNHAFSDFQAGFRKDKGCPDHIFVLQALIHLKISKGEKLFACFMDLSQAFDSPDHQKLWIVLLQYGVSLKIVRVFSYLYGLAHAHILTTEGVTDPIKIMRGVLQGESASPALFNLFVENLVDNLYKMKLAGLRLHARIVHILLYADDMVLLGSSQENLQAKINCAADFFKERGLRLNLDKTKVIIFRRGGPVSKNIWFSWRGRPIRIVNKYVYLGIIFSSSGSFSLACQEAVRKGLQAQGAIFSILPKAKLLDLELANRLFH